MKNGKMSVLSFGAIVLALTAFGCASNQPVQQPPQQAQKAEKQKVDLSGAAYAGSAACLQCHEKEGAGYARTSHAKTFKPLSAYNAQLPARIKVYDEAGKEGKNSVIELDLTGGNIHGVMSNHYVIATIPKEAGFESGPLYRVAGMGKKGDGWDIKPAATMDVDKDGKPDWLASVVNVRPDYVCTVCHSPGLHEMAKAPDKRRQGAEKLDKGIGCETCHGPGSIHCTARNAATIESGKGSCAMCHKDGRPDVGKDGAHWLFDSGNHYGTRNWFASNHYVRGKMTCFDCHINHGVNEAGKMLAGTTEQTCAACHHYPFNINEVMWKNPTDRRDHITRDHGFGFVRYEQLGDDPKTKNTEITNPDLIEKMKKHMK